MSLAVHDFGGDGPDVLLLHGGGDNVETWRDLAPLLGDFHVVAYDARGHGQSLTPDRASVDDMVADVHDLASGLGRPLLVGHSMGGMNALLAASETDAFAGVITLDSVPRWWSRPSFTRPELEEIAGSRGLGWTGTAEELEREASRLANGNRHAELIRAVFRRNHEADGKGMFRRKPELGYALRLFEIYVGPESGLTRERIEAVRCPVLMLCSEDWITDEGRRRLAEVDVPVEWLDSGHHVHWEAPAEVARRIRELACGS